MAECGYEQLHYLIDVLGISEVLLPEASAGPRVRDGGRAVSEKGVANPETQYPVTQVQLAVLIPNHLSFEALSLLKKMLKAVHQDQVLTLKYDPGRAREHSSIERQQQLRGELAGATPPFGIAFGEEAYLLLGVDGYEYSDLFGRIVEVSGVRWLVTHSIESMLTGDFEQVRGHKQVTWNHLKHLMQEWVQ